MTRYILKRLFASIVTIFILITITFFLMHIVPGGPFQSEKLTDQARENMEIKYGLDKPLLTQYGIYLKNLSKLDLGSSIVKKGREVNDIITEKFPFSAKIGFIAIGVAILIGIPLGALAAIKHETLYDRGVMLFVTVFISVPGFALGTLLLVVFSVLAGLFPASWSGDPINYVMPVIALSFYPMCYITKLTRSAMLDTLGQDYIRTAHAKGLSNFKVDYKHALKNSVMPVITYLGPLTAFIITGSFAIERIFGVPGLGKFFIESVQNRDYPVIMGTVIFLGSLLIVMNFIVDILYSFVDPKIKLQ